MSVVVVNPYGDKELLSSALERQFRDRCQELSPEPFSWDGILFQVSSKIYDNSPAFFKLV